MRRIVITFGLLAGAVMSAMLLLAIPFQDAIGFDRGAIVGYASMVLAFLMVFFGIRACRDTVGGGRISFGRACAAGAGIVAVATTCYVATWELAYHAFMPDFADKYAAYTIDQARRAGAGEARIAALQREMADFKALYANPLVNVALTALEPLPVGLLFTLVSAGILSRRREPRAAGTA